AVGETGLAGREGQRADQALEQRAFPAAVWAENGEPFTASHREVEGWKQRLFVADFGLLEPDELQGCAPSDGAAGASRGLFTRRWAGKSAATWWCGGGM